MRNNKIKGTNITVMSLAAMVVAFILMIVLVTGFRTRPNRFACRRVVKKFEKACNEFDVDGMLDCLEPTLYTNLIRIGNYVLKDDIDKLVTSLFGSSAEELGVEDSEEGMKNMFYSLKLTPVRYGFPSECRKVKCKVEAGIFMEYMDFYFVKIDGDVYIRDIWVY